MTVRSACNEVSHAKDMHYGSHLPASTEGSVGYRFRAAALVQELYASTEHGSHCDRGSPGQIEVNKLSYIQGNY